jgi:hypothetical protein
LKIEEEEVHKNQIVYFSKSPNQRDYCFQLNPLSKCIASSLIEDLHDDDAGIKKQHPFAQGRSKHFIRSYFLLQPMAEE